RHHHLALRIIAQAVVAQLLGGNGLTQPGDAVAARVDILAVANRLNRRLLDESGHWGVAYTLRQVDAADAIAFGGHGANLRLEGIRSEIAQRETRTGKRMRHGENPSFFILHAGPNSEFTAKGGPPAG